MPQLGRFYRPVQDGSGNAQSGASVAIYREGATINGAQAGVSPLALTVRHAGKIATGDTVFIETDSGTTYSATRTSATVITLAGFAGTLSVLNGQRIVPANNQPTLYSDDQGGATTGNPLATSSTGIASCWIRTGIYEALVSGAGITTTLVTSQVLPGAEEVEFNVRAWGATGDGSTDDSAAINAAITEANERGGGVVLFPRGNYKCNITLKQGVVLLGMGGRDVNAGNGATLNAFDPNTTVITFLNTASWMEVRNLTVWAGNTHCIARFTGTGAQTNLLVDNCTLQPGAGASGIYLEGDLEELYFSNIRVQAGAYGIYLANVAEAGGSLISALARCTFRDLFLTGQTKTGLRINCGTRANAIGFYNVNISNSQESAVLLSRMDDTTFVNLNIEGAAQGSGAAKWTTGSITSGTNSLVVASATGYSIGDTATVQGAGTDGVDLASVITNIVGTTFTLTDNASTTVTNADVTRSIIDMIAVDNAPGNTMGYNMTFIGCGLDDANSPVRYTMNLANTGGHCTFIDCNVGVDATSGKAPIYDPLGYATIIGGTILYRQAGVANDQFRNSTFSNANTPGGMRGAGQRTQIMSAQGGALVMGLRDSGDDGTGTYGEFEIRKRDASRSRMFRVDANGDVYSAGRSTGQFLGIKSLTELTTVAAAATTDTAIQIPANAVVFAVSVRVTVVIPTAATFTVTGTSSATQFDVAGGVAVAAGTTDVGTRNTPYKNGSAQTIRITPNLTPADNTGRVRVTIHYYEITPPTS